MDNFVEYLRALVRQPHCLRGHEFVNHALLLAADEIERLRKGTAAPAPQGPQAIPEGWRLVPVKPTMEMVRQAAGDHEGENWLPYSLWASMISAAPQPPAPKDRLSGVVEVCPICDIAGCKHLRAAPAPKSEGE